jgi:hypothetical protein
MAAYLSETRTAFDDCMAPLYAAWHMPLLDPATACRIASTDEDEGLEIVAVITNGTPSCPAASVRASVVVFDADVSGKLVVAYVTPPFDATSPTPGAPVGPLVAAGDLNGDGIGEFAYVTENCGAHTLVDSVHIMQGSVSGYTPLAPIDGISIETPTKIAFEDAAGGGKQLVLRGGVIDSAGAGPQRQRTETWAWNGSTFAIVSSNPAPPEYLYHAIIDANAVFESGDYARAGQMYAAAAADDTLKEWMPDRRERAELDAWALFRAGLAVLLRGGDTVTASSYFDRAKGESGTLHAQLAGSFEAAYAAKGSISVGCGAANDDVHANLAEYQAFWDFGYGNPAFDPATVCPF